MSNNTTTPETSLRKPLVISLRPPHVPGSAVDRFLSDMFLRGLVEISTIPEDGDISASESTRTPQDTPQDTPVGADVSSSDPGENAAYSTDEGFPEIKLTEAKATLVREQRYRVYMEILNQPVTNIGNLRRFHGEHLRMAAYLLELDNGSNTTFVPPLSRYNCRELRLGPSSTASDGRPPFSVHEPLSLETDERAKIFDHVYIPEDSLDLSDPNGPARGLVKYGDGHSGAIVFMHNTELKISIPGFNWAENSWVDGQRMLLDYKPSVACAATKAIYSRPMSGILALGPMRHQSVFSNAVDHLQAPAFLEALKPCLPSLSEGGTIVYLAIRPMALYRNTATSYYLLDREEEHWMALNGWPCEHQADWSPPIYLVPETLGGERHWKVRLLSMTFQHYDADKQKCKDLDDLDARTITFGDGGLIVHLDCGTSVSFVPPGLVRHIRTKLWPTPANKKIDAKYQDSPCEPHSPAVQFYAPDNECMGIVYTFVDGRGTEVRVTGPSSHFFSEPNPFRRCRSNLDGEGLVFTGPQEVIGESEAIFGLNFFQSMYVALHNPDDGDAYVRLAPQWDAQRDLFSPRPKTNGP